MTEAGPRNNTPEGTATWRSFTPDEAREMVRAALGARSRLILPNPAALGKLAWELTDAAWRATQLPRQPDPNTAAMWQMDALVAAKELIPALEVRRAATAVVADSLRAAATEQSWKDQAAPHAATQTAISLEVAAGAEHAVSVLDTLRHAIAAAIPILEPWPEHKWRGDKWEEYIREFVHIFRTALHSTNPNLKLGISNDGPVARFVAAAVNRIFNELVTVAAIAQRLKRIRADQDR